MVLTRAISIYGLGFLSNRLANSQISISEQTVLCWGGLRGSVSIALALSIPVMIPEREEIIATVFGAVLFTLLVQGLTAKPLLAGLNLLGDLPLRQKYSEAIARQSALNRVLQHLEQTEKRPGIEPEFYRYRETLVRGELSRLQTEIEELQNDYPNLRRFTTEQLQAELLGIEAETYAELMRSGQLNKELAPFLQSVSMSGEEKEESVHL